MSLKHKETKFKPRMKLNHNIYKNSLNKFCSQKDFVSRVIHWCVSSWLFFRVYKEIRKELNKSEPTLSYVFIRNHFFLNTARLFDTRERFFPFFKLFWLLISLKKNYLQQNTAIFFCSVTVKWGRYKQLKQETSAWNCYGFWLDGRLIRHMKEKKKPFTVPSGPTILLTCEKIIVASPDFFDLYKNLPLSCKFSVFKSPCAFIYNKPCLIKKLH